MSYAKKVGLLVGSLALGASIVVSVPSDAQAAAPKCTIDTSYNNNAIAAFCKSGPGTYFVAYIRCTNSGNLFGPERRYNTLSSAVGCPGNGTIVQKGVGTR